MLKAIDFGSGTDLWNVSKGEYGRFTKVLFIYVWFQYTNDAFQCLLLGRD